MIIWIDARAGVSGDMFLGALHDVGVPLDVLQTPLDQLDVGIRLRAEQVTRASLASTKLHVDVAETQTVRHLPDIVELLQPIDETTRRHAVSVFEALATAEAAVHRTTPNEVHFHEVGALDSIADIVGVCAGIAWLKGELGVTSIHCSTVSLGNGQTQGAHGPIPVPAPAVLSLLQDCGLVQAGPAPFEATTPTGAALLREFVSEWGPMPEMTIDRVGLGAGSRDAVEVANVLRLVAGPSAEGSTPRPTGSLIQIDTNIDDMDARLFPTAIDAALTAGALDAWVTPIIMKKGRPAHTFSVLTDEIHAADVRGVVFRSTTTIGLREHRVDRHTLDRSFGTIEVDGQLIRVKSATLGEEVVNASVEWDDVVAAAAVLHRPVADVLAEAERSLRS